MGCDGGTIPRRDELVRTKKKPEQKDKNSELAFKWKHCALSQENLVKPIVACELGRLYNKESVLEFLLDKSKFELASGFDHISGLKDIKELNLTDNPVCRAKDAEKGDGSFIDPSVSDYICPVVGLEMSGKYRFCFIWSCGCVLSERAFREVKSDTCQKCWKAFKTEDVIVLNGTDDEVDYFESRMIERRALAKALKKSKKANKRKTTDVETTGPVKTAHLDTPSTSSSSPQSVTASTQPNGHTDPKDIDKKCKPNGKLVKSGKTLDKISNGDKVGKTSSIQKDPRSSKTFKSLFTTSEAEKLQEKPHWITYNPLYY